MNKRYLLLIIIFSSLGAMIPEEQMQKLQSEFTNAIANQRWDRASELIAKAQQAERGITARDWLSILQEARARVEQEKRVAEKVEAQMQEMRKRKEVVEQKATQEAFELAGQRAQEIKRLKEEVSKATAAHKEIGSIGQLLLSKIDADNKEIETLRQERNVQVQEKNKAEAQLAAELLRTKGATDSNVKLLNEINEKNNQIYALQRDLIQVNKDKEALKQGMPSKKANEELRLRLAEAEKALQAQTQKAETAQREMRIQKEEVDNLKGRLQSGISYANSLSRSKEIKQSDIRDLLEILRK